MCPLHHLHHHNCHHPDTRPQGQIECKCPTHCGTHQKLAVYWNKSPIIGPQHRDRLAYACTHWFRCPPPSENKWSLRRSTWTGMIFLCLFSAFPSLLLDRSLH